jgi:pilus assembly protein CpaE
VPEVSVINPNETSGSWKTSKRDAALQLYLSSVDAGASELVEARPCGYPTSITVIGAEDWIEPDNFSGAIAAIVQVDPSHPASIKRFQQLAAAVPTPLIAAAYDPPLALVRSLIRAGAHDVIPLPISVEELEVTLAPIKAELAKARKASEAATGKVVSVIKSVGGVGATSLLTQLAIRFTERERSSNRQVCLIDLDLQFGDAAFQLGLEPKLSLLDLLQAGSRLDGDLLRATTTEHPSGLRILAAPAEMVPIEGMPTDHLLRIIELAKREFDTVFVDLPTNWTNWSLSVVAQSDLVLLVTELTVASISRAKRQLALLHSQELADLDLRVVVNRYDKSLARTVRPSDIRSALGRDIAYTISNDFALMRSAVDRGVPISELKRKSALGKDIDALDAGIAATLKLER